jgi:S-adenosylmethionine:tRNA ribosyltransferase-isomerase
MFHLNDFNFELPKKFIAQTPINPRDHSKLLVFNRITKTISEKLFYNLPEIIDKNYFIIRNNSKVIKARMFGKKETGGKVEIFLIKNTNKENNIWQCLTKPGLKVNQIVYFDEKINQNKDQLKGIIIEKSKENLIKFNCSLKLFLKKIEKIGHTPLPPYIKTEENKIIAEQYQTTYANKSGSIAAPTAGLHFTKELDRKLKDKGANISDLTLHVGLGTFLPVKTEIITDHKMHSEEFIITQEVANQINENILKGKKILSVGTTTLRALESSNYFDEKYQKFLVKPNEKETNIFIYPPFQFKIVNSLITNFHLPKSTLLMLVASLLSQPNAKEEFVDFDKSSLGRIYQFAIENNYRFFSFGDAMLIL